MIIERLFSGEIYPAENVAPLHDGEYVQLGAKVSEQMNRLQKVLSEADYSVVEELHKDLMSMQMKETEANFGYGLSVGIMLALEVMENLSRYK